MALGCGGLALAARAPRVTVLSALMAPSVLVAVWGLLTGCERCTWGGIGAGVALLLVAILADATAGQR